ncbi:MAG: 23S rRNA (uracil(1939)-C(5))-methyltransferase RlmD [Clostridiaceae bacterium]|nr:23S rRNA (uracil(1939)-C(5))-methyltransferase RlmD [Clostridiaceae bacterium]
MVTHSHNQTINAGDLIELDIFDLNQHGQGVGRHNGMIVFVEDALPGETVKAKIETVKKNYATGVINKIIVFANDRVEPLCPLAVRCGGCAVQHLNYKAQLNWKQEHVASLLDRTGPTGWNRDKLLPIIGMDNPWHYRGKVQIPFSGSSDKPLAGFYARRSHQIIDGEECLIQHPIADLVRTIIRNYIRDNKLNPYDEKSNAGTVRHIIVRTGFFSGQVMVILVTRDEDLPALADLTNKLRIEISSWKPEPDNKRLTYIPEEFILRDFELSSLWLSVNDRRSNVVMGERLKLVYGQEYMLEEILGIQYRISPRAFFQVNPYQTVNLYQEVLNMAELAGTETVLDLYCGTGSISLLLAARAAYVRGVEIIEEAIADAWLNAKTNNINNVEFIAAAAEIWLPEYLSGGGTADLAVIDPPRKGCDAELIRALCEADIPALIYVSCNPATLVRDLVILGSSYEVVSVRPVDMFPHSDSVECVVRLERIRS